MNGPVILPAEDPGSTMEPSCPQVLLQPLQRLEAWLRRRSPDPSVPLILVTCVGPCARIWFLAQGPCVIGNDFLPVDFGELKQYFVKRHVRTVWKLDPFDVP